MGSQTCSGHAGADEVIHFSRVAASACRRPGGLVTVIASCREGCSAIRDFDAFFEANYWPIVRSLRAGFGDDAEVDEAVQDAFVRAHVRWRRIGRYDSPAAWIRRVAINRLHDQLRKRQRRQRAERAAFDENVGPDAEYRTRGGPLVQMIESLPPRQRVAMALFYVEDLSVRDIAASMGITEGAVKAHLSLGRANLARDNGAQREPAEVTDD